MPVEDMEEQGLSKIPDLGVAQLKFQLQHLKYSNPSAKNQVLFLSTVNRVLKFYPKASLVLVCFV
jgi:hypothetical protein